MNALLLSGGMDSVSLAYWKKPRFAITIDYGQIAAPGEIAAASKVASELGIQHHIVSADCSAVGSGDMAGRASLKVAPVPEWWPFRNQLLVTLAGARALSLGVTELLIGTVVSDGRHADARPDFFSQIDQLMAMQEGGLRVTAPAMAMTALELVRASGIPRSLLAWSHSCHTGAFACGGCRGCVKHFQTMDKLYGDAY
ncbi:MAG: 7-cyano-7-deazaguanine synthase [Gammaproteobacteria bacterium]|nr:7-cyano-7-deazaguanine synthase [Gammaproteobacteria bacterium]MYF66520.1 7-cyano-7-deazaguanine synthase [Gammaproteobacteria bacterium]MYK37167.1 7-cyano-7-deazaguanine synthase [Gammaproteobacteria bacterium]